MAEHYDVIVVGAGVTGLLIAKKLGDLGYTVGLFEKSLRLADGPSTRNEGWLHRGTYHATSIPDPTAATQVARRVIWGHEQIRTYAPEAIEAPEQPSYCFTSIPERVPEIRDRWESAGVWHRPVTRTAITAAVPEVDTNAIAAAFEVRDVSVNTRVLYRKLFIDAQRAGVRVHLGARVVEIDGDSCIVENSDGDRDTYRATLFVTTAGYGTTQFLGSAPEKLRYWKSHLLITPRLTRYNIFSVDPHVAAMMNHADVSIVGLNEDALLVGSPSYQPLEENIDAIRQSIRSIYLTFDEQRSQGLACVKVDFAISDHNDPRSLNVAVRRPAENVYCVLPGKMTEAPFVADRLIQVVHDTIGCDHVSLRPCDAFGRSMHSNSGKHQEDGDPYDTVLLPL